MPQKAAPPAIPDPAKDDPLVLIVDDDAGMREAVVDLLQSVGIEARAFGSTAELLAAALPDRLGCLILDVRLPGLGGLEFQTKLDSLGIALPIVFMTGFADVPMSVRAMKAGATDFLIKPFRDQDLIDPRGYEKSYEVVARRLRRRIEGGEFRWHAPLPSEPALAEWYGVSRTTVRSAIEVLIGEGLVERVRGKGTYVTWRR